MKLKNNIGRVLLELLYPGRCPVCDGILAFGEGRIHKHCAKVLQRVGPVYCLKCGRPIFREEDAFCRHCREEKHDFDSGVSVYMYRGEMKASIYRFKYGNRQEYAGYYGRELAKAIAARRDMRAARLIVPVPLYSEKLLQRGFNQAQLLAQEVSALLKIPMKPDLVRRVRATTAQKELGAYERRKNLKKAFKIGQDDVELDSIIVVDDIFTTGSTIDGVARVLKEAGAKKVYAATLAIGVSKD